MPSTSCWQRCRFGRGLMTQRANVGRQFSFGAAFFAGVCFHYYFAMGLAPYVLWELLRWKPGRRPSAKLIAGIVGSIIPVVLLSPLILSFSRKFSGGYWNRPSFNELRAIFSQLFPDGLFLLALIMVWIVVTRSDIEKETTLQPMQSAEAVGWLFLTIPLAAFVVAEWKTNAFYSRYFIGVLPGVAVAFAFLLWRHFRKTAQVSMGVFVLLAAWGVGQQLTVVRRPDKVEATGIRSFLQVESALQIEGKRYFVFPDLAVSRGATVFGSSGTMCAAVACRLQPASQGRTRSLFASASGAEPRAVLSHAILDAGRTAASSGPSGPDRTR
jgi:hypothetical protein